MFNGRQVPVAATPNAWSNDDLPDLGKDTTFEQTIDDMAKAGYEGTEMGSKYPTDAATLKAALDERGLKASGSWVSLFFASGSKEYDETLQTFRDQIPFFKDVGIRDVYVAEVTNAVHQKPVAALENAPKFDDDQWSAMVTGLNEMGKIAAENDLRVCYHHHVGTAVMDNDQVDRMLSDTDPAYVWLLLDPAHSVIGGGDPLALAQKHASRVGHVHLKNAREPVLQRMRNDGLSFWDALREGIFTVPGDPEGMIDLMPILKLLDDAGYEGWMVVEAEQDPAKANPLEYFTMARNYLRDEVGI